MRHRFGVLVLLVCLYEPAQAATIGYADAIDRLAGACGADISKYCHGVPFGNGGIESCLARNGARISESCRTTNADVATLLEKRAAAQAAVPRVCRDDARTLCGSVVVGSGHMLACVLKAGPVVSRRCNNAITDAGWR